MKEEVDDDDMWRPVIIQEKSWEGECPPDMIANNLIPAYPTHPGSVLKDEIEYRGIRQRKMAKDMGIPYKQLHGILNAVIPVTEETAALFEKVLGVNAKPLVKMQKRYDELTADKKNSFSTKFRRVLSNVTALF